MSTVRGVGRLPHGSAGPAAEAFSAAVEPHRRELLVHCYRMLGSGDKFQLAPVMANGSRLFGRGT